MADTKLSALTADATPTSDDLLYLVNDPVGTPASKKVTVGNIHLGMTAASATVASVVELATIVEVDTGTDTTRAITPAGLAGSALSTAVTANTAKVTNVSTTLSSGTTTATTYGITSDGGADDIVLPEATTSVAGLLGADKWDEIVANTLKATNVSTSLSSGTITATTYGITSDGGTDDIVLPEATTSVSGLLGADKWDEIVANTLKSTNVSTALSTGTVSATTYGITSDGGTDDVVLVEATTSVSGLLGASKWDEIVANTAKVTNANHTGDVTGATALTIATGAVDVAMMSATGTPDGTTFYRGDNTWNVPAGGGDVSKVGTPVDDEIGVWTGDGTIEGDSNFTFDGAAAKLTVLGTAAFTSSATTGTTHNLSLIPTASLAESAEWHGIHIDGGALDPSGTGANMYRGLVCS